MKKVLLLLAAMVSLMSFNSCQKEKDPTPDNPSGMDLKNFRYLSFEALNTICDYWGIYFASGDLAINENYEYTGTGVYLGVGIYCREEGGLSIPNAGVYNIEDGSGHGIIARIEPYVDGKYQEGMYRLSQDSKATISYPTATTFSFSLKGSVLEYGDGDQVLNSYPIDFTYSGDLNVRPYPNNK